MSKEQTRKFTVNEKGGNLPYMIAWVSKGGWISTEKLTTYTELRQREKELQELKLKPAMFIVLTDSVKNIVVSEK